jgi:hypothetical protein
MATWSVLVPMGLMISLAGTAVPGVARAGEGAAPAAGPAMVEVRAAPGVDLPAPLAADVRAAVEDALAGRPPAAVPIELTLDAAGVDVRVGSLARRVTIVRWDDVALRTIALHVLDLMQPGPEVVAPAAPAESVATVATVAPAAEPPPSPSPEAWCVRAGAAGLRGVENDNPWTVAFTAGGAWTREWMRVGAEVGWERAPRHQIYNLVPVTYDAWPVRLVGAAQAGMLEGGIRAGVEVFRVATDHSIWSYTPLVGAFLGIRVPATPWLHAVIVGGADALPRRVQLYVGGATPYTTPRVAPYAGLIIEVGLKP